jgi:hypothetical protein
MIIEIVNALLPSLAPLSFGDLIVGIVKPMRFRNEGGEKVFPVIYNEGLDACISGSYIDLLPNSSKKSIIYFEDKGTYLAKEEKGRFFYRSTIWLVCWWNYKLTSSDLYEDTPYVGNVLALMPHLITGLDFISHVRLRMVRQLPKDADMVFGKYTYNEAEVQFVTYPYDFFALEYDVTFIFNPACVTPITEKTACL